MWEAVLCGSVAGAALLLGAGLGAFLPTSARVVGLVLGFGIVVLISAVAFEVTLDAFDRGGGWEVLGGLLARG